MNSQVYYMLLSAMERSHRIQGPPKFDVAFRGNFLKEVICGLTTGG